MKKLETLPVAINRLLLPESVHLVDGVLFAGSVEAVDKVLKELNDYTLVDSCDPPFLLHKDGTMVEFDEKQLANFRRIREDERKLFEGLDADIEAMERAMRLQ